MQTKGLEIVRKKKFLVDFSKIDFENPIAEVDDIRALNPQRHEMEQLSAIVYEDLENKECVGYLDVSDHEFWIRGHMPQFPIMPGVIMLESVAQMCSYFVRKHNLLESEIVGFGGVEKVRFREPVLPGHRLILVARVTRIRPKWMVTCEFQGIVDNKIVLEGSLKGIPLPVKQLSNNHLANLSNVNGQPNLAAN